MARPLKKNNEISSKYKAGLEENKLRLDTNRCELEGMIANAIFNSDNIKQQPAQRLYLNRWRLDVYDKTPASREGVVRSDQGSSRSGKVRIGWITIRSDQGSFGSGPRRSDDNDQPKPRCQAVA